MNCSQCGAPIAPGANFCDQCGARLPAMPGGNQTSIICRNCGRSLPMDSNFCVYCGASVKPISVRGPAATLTPSTVPPVVSTGQEPRRFQWEYFKVLWGMPVGTSKNTIQVTGDTVIISSSLEKKPVYNAETVPLHTIADVNLCEKTSIPYAILCGLVTALVILIPSILLFMIWQLGWGSFFESVGVLGLAAFGIVFLTLLGGDSAYFFRMHHWDITIRTTGKDYELSAKPADREQLFQLQDAIQAYEGISGARQTARSLTSARILAGIVVVGILLATILALFSQYGVPSMGQSDGIYDPSDMLSDETEAFIRSYNEAWDSAYGSITAVVTTKDDLTEDEFDQYVERYFSKMGLRYEDSLLLIYDDGYGQIWLHGPIFEDFYQQEYTDILFSESFEYVGAGMIDTDLEGCLAGFYNILDGSYAYIQEHPGQTFADLFGEYAPPSEEIAYSTFLALESGYSMIDAVDYAISSSSEYEASLPSDMVGKQLSYWFYKLGCKTLKFQSDGSFSYEYQYLSGGTGEGNGDRWKVQVDQIEQISDYSYLLYVADVTPVECYNMYYSMEEERYIYEHYTPSKSDYPYQPGDTVQLVLPGAGAYEVTDMQGGSFDSSCYYIDGYPYEMDG